MKTSWIAEEFCNKLAKLVSVVECCNSVSIET